MRPVSLFPLKSFDFGDSALSVAFTHALDDDGSPQSEYLSLICDNLDYNDLVGVDIQDFENQESCEMLLPSLDEYFGGLDYEDPEMSQLLEEFKTDYPTLVPMVRQVSSIIIKGAKAYIVELDWVDAEDDDDDSNSGGDDWS